MKHLRHRLHSQEDGGADSKNKEHRHHDFNLKKKNDAKEHHHHYSNIASFFRQRIVTQTTKRRIPKELTISQEWILRLLISSLFLFVLSFMILIVWLILFPQDSPNNTHIEIFFLRNNNNRAANGKDNVVLAPQLPSLDNIKVSVVIMNHNRPRLLQQSQLLPTLIAHPNVDEILLAHSNPATQFDYYKDYYAPTTSNNNQTTTTIRSSNNNKIVNINATQANMDMGLSLRFHYCAQQARNEFVMMIDDDQEMTLDAISRLILEFSVSDNNSSSSTLNDGNDNDNENNNNNMPYNPHRIVGRYGRVYHEDSTWWSWYHVANHGYDTRTYTGRVEVVLTKFMILHRSTCQAFFDYQHLVWNDLVLPHGQQSKPLWNGEDIFMSLVANHLYQKHQLQQQQQQQHQQSHSKGIVPFNNYATSSLNVWEAPAVDELDTDTTDTTTVTTGRGNSKTGISGNMDRHVLFWNVGWTEYWQIKARARDHIHYRGLLWFTARQRLAALLQEVVPQEVKSSSLS